MKLQQGLYNTAPAFLLTMQRNDAPLRQVLFNSASSILLTLVTNMYIQIYGEAGLCTYHNLAGACCWIGGGWALGARRVTQSWIVQYYLDPYDFRRGPLAVKLM